MKDRREGLPRKNASDYWGQYAQHYTQGYADAEWVFKRLSFLRRMKMEIREVAAAGRVSDGRPSMGTLADEGILKKEYQRSRYGDSPDIVWTNVSENVIVKNGHDTISPGESVTWEK